MRLKVLYDQNNEKKLYREDENGKEYVYFRDNREKIIIRDFYESDFEKWYKTLFSGVYCLDPKHKEGTRRKFIEAIKERNADDLEICLAVTTTLGKILGQLEFTPADEIAESKVEIRLKNDYVSEYAENVVNALWNMHKRFRWYDKLFVRKVDGGFVELKVEKKA